MPTARGRWRPATLDVELTQPTRLTAQVLCVAVRTPAAPTCPRLVRAPGADPRREIAAGKPVVVPLGTLPPGRHRLSIALDDTGATFAGSVRFLSDRALPGAPEKAGSEGHPVPVARSVRAFAATRGQPVTVTLLGPTVVRVEGRQLGSGAATRLAIRATPTGGDKGAVTAAFALPASPDPRAQLDGSSVAVASPGQTWLFLPRPVPYRLHLTPEGGRVAVRLALRQDLPGDPAPAPPPWWLRAGVEPLLRWPALSTGIRPIEAVHVTPCPEARGWGTLSVGVTGAIDGAEEVDSPTQLRRWSVELAPVWRRRFGSADAEDPEADRGLWLRVGPLVRLREPGEKTGALVVGGGFETETRGLPLDLRLRLGAAFFGQDTTSSGLVTTVRGAASLERRFALGPAFAVTPQLRFRARTGKTPLEPEGIDPDVFTDYAADHPLALTPRLTFRLAPFRDLAFTLSAAAITNADVASLDQVAGTALVTTLLPVLGGTELEARWRPSQRFADDDRPDAFLRHDVGASLAWSFGNVRKGRLWLGVDWDLAKVPALAAHHAVRLTLRWDSSGGRGLADFAPNEQRFDALVEDRRWGEPAEVAAP